MHRSQPFARAIAMMALIAAAAGDSMKLGQIGPYRSRGKGQGQPSKSYSRGGRSKYRPHYGAKESAKFAARFPEIKLAA